MTLDEAITHAEDIAKTCKDEKCSEEHQALADWLRELRYRRQIHPEKKIGHWIIHRDWIADGECGYECSVCGRCYDYDMNYCGYCGAKMRVEDETD